MAAGKMESDSSRDSLSIIDLDTHDSITEVPLVGYQGSVWMRTDPHYDIPSEIVQEPVSVEDQCHLQEMSPQLPFINTSITESTPPPPLQDEHPKLPQLSLSIKEKLRNKVQVMREQEEEEVSLSLISSTSESTVSDISSVSAYSSQMRRNFQNSDEEDGDDTGHIIKKIKRVKRAAKKSHCICNYSIHPHGSFYLWWLGFMFCVYMYNIITLPLRASFPFVQGTNFTPIGTLRGPPEVDQVGVLIAWLVIDSFMDILYLVDMVFICSHLRPIDNSKAPDHQVKLKDLWKKYVLKKRFWVDIISLLPLDILHLVPLLRFNVLLRIPRLFRIHNVYIFFDQFESSTKYPHAFRLTKMAGYLLFTVHIYACIYYAVSAREGFGVSTWVYNGEGNSYLHCFYWALMSIATIHDLNERDPTSDIEFLLGGFGHLIGVFIIAIVISEITNIVEAANLQRQLFRQKQDLLNQFMQSHKIPQELQNKVKLWSDYTFTHQKMMDEDEALNSLPRNMRSEIAINVHLDTLSKVKIFKGFERNLLRDLVLKLHPLLVIPGEYICQKGEIGREMYIVNQGKVQVIGGVDDDLKILVELGPGSVFGEISLLAVGGGNRRTAHVRSKGFSNLFVLSKKDLYDTLVDYPEAQERLKKKAKFILQQDKKRTSQPAPPNSAFAKIAMEAKRRQTLDKVSSKEPSKCARGLSNGPPIEECPGELFVTKTPYYMNKSNESNSNLEETEEIETDSHRKVVIEIHEQSAN